MTPDTLASLMQARRQRASAVLATRLADGWQRLLVQPDAEAGAGIAPALLEAARAAVVADRSRTVTLDAEDWFLQVHLPAPRLLLVGAVHVAQALAPLAQAAGVAVTVIDPRQGFATEARFPGTELLRLWPDEALTGLRIDSRTAIVTLSHEARLDDPALHAALASDAFYVGALGSRKTQAARRERLRALGHGDAALARLHGPVGLAIGAVGPNEIAVSIVAELVAVRRRAPLGGLAVVAG
ncbi:XdhC family protein [Lichenicoccus sp.]|uniref:XdhC family protein n=1 Tax=Lichenicoccus sp. TaxID=2781899 RepID=UPI003D14B820